MFISQSVLNISPSYISSPVKLVKNVAALKLFTSNIIYSHSVDPIKNNPKWKKCKII